MLTTVRHMAQPNSKKPKAKPRTRLLADCSDGLKARVNKARRATGRSEAAFVVVALERFFAEFPTADKYLAAIDAHNAAPAE
jgi:hypothetical protein